MAEEARKFYELVHPGAPGGIVLEKPEMQEQDAEFEPEELFVVVFFPKITGIGPARVWFHKIHGTLAQSPEAAKMRFMDGIKQGEKWETYADAGHRIRRVKIVDLGDA